MNASNSDLIQCNGFVSSLGSGIDIFRLGLKQFDVFAGQTLIGRNAIIIRWHIEGNAPTTLTIGGRRAIGRTKGGRRGSRRRSFATSVRFGGRTGNRGCSTGSRIAGSAATTWEHVKRIHGSVSCTSSSTGSSRKQRHGGWSCWHLLQLHRIIIMIGMIVIIGSRRSSIHHSHGSIRMHVHVHGGHHQLVGLLLRVAATKARHVAIIVRLLLLWLCSIHVGKHHIPKGCRIGIVHTIHLTATNQMIHVHVHGIAHRVHIGHVHAVRVAHVCTGTHHHASSSCSGSWLKVGIDAWNAQERIQLLLLLLPWLLLLLLRNAKAIAIRSCTSCSSRSSCSQSTSAACQSLQLYNQWAQESVQHTPTTSANIQANGEVIQLLETS